MHLDWTFHAGDIIITVIGVVFTLCLKPLFTVLMEMRDALLRLAPRVDKLEQEVGLLKRENALHSQFLARLGFFSRGDVQQPPVN